MTHVTHQYCDPWPAWPVIHDYSPVTVSVTFVCPRESQGQWLVWRVVVSHGSWFLGHGSRGSWANDRRVTWVMGQNMWPIVSSVTNVLSDYSRELVQFFSFPFSSNDGNNSSCSSSSNNNNRSNIRFVASVAKQDDVHAVASPAKVVNRLGEMNRWISESMKQ